MPEAVTAEAAARRPSPLTDTAARRELPPTPPLHASDWHLGTVPGKHRALFISQRSQIHPSGQVAPSAPSSAPVPPNPLHPHATSPDGHPSEGRLAPISPVVSQGRAGHPTSWLPPSANAVPACLCPGLRRTSGHISLCWRKFTPHHPHLIAFNTIDMKKRNPVSRCFVEQGPCCKRELQ